MENEVKLQALRSDASEIANETNSIEYEGDNKEEKFIFLEKRIYYPKDFDFPDEFL